MATRNQKSKPPGGFPIKKAVPIKKRIPIKKPVPIVKKLNSPRLASNVAPIKPVKRALPPKTPPNPNSFLAKVKKANQACIWVGFGLSKVEEGPLRAQLAKHGYAKEILNITCQENPKGNYAFVDVESMQIAKEIITKLNGMPMNGITLQMRLRGPATEAKKQPVKNSTPTELPPHNDEPPADLFTKVWVGFGQDKNEQKTKDIANELQVLFSRMGEIKKFETCSNKKGNVAFITYESSLHAKKAINTYNGRVVKGHKIVVRRGNPSSEDHGASSEKARQIQDKARQLQDQVITLQESNEDLKMQVQYLKHQKGKRMDEIKLLQLSNDEKSNENKELLAMIQEYKQKGRDHIDRISELQEKLIAERDASMRLREEAAKLRDEARYLQDDNRRLAREVEQFLNKQQQQQQHHHQRSDNHNKSGGNKGRRKNNYKGKPKKQRDNQDNQVPAQQQQHTKGGSHNRGRKKGKNNRGGRGIFQNAVEQAHSSNNSRGSNNRGRGRGRGGRGRKHKNKKPGLANAPSPPEVKRESNV